MYLYICKRDSNRKPSDYLILEALKDYRTRNSLAISDEQIANTKIMRDQKGKPYFPDMQICFSVSHSQDWWSCLMAGEQVGLDIEVPKEHKNYIKISERFFTNEEIEYVKSNGEDSFYDIWVRKEAYLKYVGTGISEGLSTFSVVENGKLLGHIDQRYQGKKKKEGTLFPIRISDQIKAAYCSAEDNSIKDMINLL